MGAPAGSFGGDLGLVGLFDLGQLLQLNRATGQLIVTREGRRAFLVFEEGQVVNAIDDERREGEEAAYRVFVWKSGAFEFRPDAPGASRLISCSTEALMLEAARRLDEGATPATEGQGTEERLRERQGSMEALRQAFKQVASDAHAPGAGMRSSADELLSFLRAPADRLLLLSDRRVLLRTDGQWHGLEAPPGDAEALERIRERVCDEAGARAIGVVTRRLRDARGESLWLRRVGPGLGARPRPAGPNPALDFLSRSRQALVWAGAPDPDAVEELAASLAGWAAAARGGTALVVDDGVAGPAGPPGLVLHAAPRKAPAWLDVLRPDVLALTGARLPGEALVRRLPGVPVLVVGVVAASEAQVPGLGRALLAGARARGVRGFLSRLPAGVAWSPGAAGDCSFREIAGPREAPASPKRRAA